VGFRLPSLFILLMAKYGRQTPPCWVVKCMRSERKNNKNQVLAAFMACRDGLVRSLLRMKAKPEDVDDILQETYLRVLGADEKKAIQSYQGYLFTVSRNLVLEKLKANDREITSTINDAILEGGELSAEHHTHYRNKLSHLNQALMALPKNKRQAILLRKYYGLSHKEIASKMKVSVSSVEKYIESGIRQCKTTLAKQGYEFDGLARSRQKRADPSSSSKGGAL